jgi:two-component system KDP operon response regulator KdpE
VSEKGRILVVDDEPQLCHVLQTFLSSCGYEVWNARTGGDALNLVRSEQFDLILLDINLPDMTGIEVCRQIRAASNVGIVMLTVLTSETDKIAALDAGADDYVTKPFAASELRARIRANMRGQEPLAEFDAFKSDDFVIDFERRIVVRQGKKFALSRKQHQLLRYLVGSGGKPLSHRTLLRAIWGPDHSERTVLLRALVKRIREIIEPEPNKPRYIVTLHHIGYRFDAQLERARADR